MYKLVRLTLLTLACGAVPAVALAGLPTSQPALVTIVREEVKVDREAERLSRADGEVLNRTRTIQAAARTDLSLGAYPDLAKPS